MGCKYSIIKVINRAVVQEGRRLSSNREEMAVRLRPTIY